MLGFFKKFGSDTTDGPLGRGFIQGGAHGVTLINLDRCWWCTESGSNDILTLKTAGGRELHDTDDHAEALRGAFLRLGRESSENQLIEAARDNQSPLLVIYPSLSRMRNIASEIFEDYLKRRFKASGSDFDILRIYSSPIRPGKTKVVRKFRGRNASQVILNLCGEGLNYFHLNTVEKDPTVDALIEDWPAAADVELLTQRTEEAVRKMDPKYFERLRGGIESGLLVAIMPEFKSARTAVLGAAGRLLNRAPGGAIDLLSPKILRLHRTMQAPIAD